MKNYQFRRIIGIVILFGLFTTCRNEDAQMLQIQGAHLNIDEVKTFIPASIKNEQVMVYVNASGQIKRMKALYMESEIEFIHKNGQRYTKDVFEADVYQIDNHEIRIAINGSANFGSDSHNVLKGLLYILAPHGPNSLWAFMNFTDGEPNYELLPGGDKSFQPTYDALGRTFNNVCNFDRSNYIPGYQQDAFSQLIVNSEVGIVAFRDHTNDLWVFDHVE